jgi:UDP-2,3-diacylglucosamine pyrophosphatase LpxH
MKLHILSDLHNEWTRFYPPETDADVVVLAGDIHKHASGINWARGAFPGKEIIYVPGNHEFYGAQRQEINARMRIAARECNIHLLDNSAVVIGGVRFLGATLWTDFNLLGDSETDRAWAMHIGQQGLTDFRVIHEGFRHFSPMDSVKLHNQSLLWLKSMLDKPFEGKTVVVTHHLPSMQSVADRFIDEPLSACFASNLDDLFGGMVLWVHGHTHDSFDYVANGTRVICNPRGCATSDYIENHDFSPGLVVEI